MKHRSPLPFRTPALRSTTTLLALGLVLAGCGNLTAGGFGEATVRLSGDAADTAAVSTETATGLVPSLGAVGRRLTDEGSVPSIPSPSDHVEDSTDSSDSSGSDDDPEGEVETELTVFLVAEDGDLVALTDTDVRVRVDLDGIEEPEIASRTVNATAYTALRMVFTEIEAEVDAGLVIDGQPIMGPVDVDLDDVSLVVSKPLDLQVDDDERVEILIDLNAGSWLLAVDPATNTVDAQTFVDLVSVSVR